MLDYSIGYNWDNKDSVLYGIIDSFLDYKLYEGARVINPYSIKVAVLEYAGYLIDSKIFVQEGFKSPQRDIIMQGLLTMEANSEFAEILLMKIEYIIHYFINYFHKFSPRFEKYLSANPLEDIYIAGKITHLEEDVYIKNFNEVEKKLRDAGKQGRIYNPVSLCSILNNENWLDCMLYLIPYVIKSDCVIAQDNWHNSAGSQVELFVNQIVMRRKNYLFKFNQN